MPCKQLDSHPEGGIECRAGTGGVVGARGNHKTSTCAQAVRAAQQAGYLGWAHANGRFGQRVGAIR